MLARSPRPASCSGSSGFTLMELLITMAIVATIAAIAAPRLLRARISANESAVIGSLRAVNNAQAAYASGAADNSGYAPSFRVLSAACPGATMGFISPDLSSDPSQRSGYQIDLTGSGAAGPTDCNGEATRLAYYLTSRPLSIGLTGNRGFATSNRAVIYFDPGGTPPPEADIAPGGPAMPLQ